MRSFFNKPAWAAKGGGTTNEFYRRSEQTYSDIVAANREAQKKPKNPPEANKKNSIISNEGTERSKRPRLSDEQNQDAVTALSVPLDEQDNLKEDISLPACLDDLPNAPVTPHHEVHECSGVSPGVSDPSSISTPSMNCADQSAPSNPPAHPSAHPVAAGQNDAKPCSALPSPRKSPQPSKPSEPPAEDPVVQILITSEIPNTKPLLVHRKMSQGLREVRLEWCKRQGLTTGAKSPVYLTWRDRRLFDVTTCRTLGIKPGNNTRAPLEMDDDFLTGAKELRIHIKAVTDDPLLLNRPGSAAEMGQPSPAPLSPSHQANEENEPMKLTLRSPGLSDLKIKARPKTRVSKLITVFRGNQNISADQDICLVFDGDILDPSTCLVDHDIADLDLVDVQIKPRI